MPVNRRALIVAMALLCSCCRRVYACPQDDPRAFEIANTGSATSDSGNEPGGATPRLERATFGAGCFWCTEAIFHELRGVKEVVSGYAGGNLPNPTYEEVCTGQTGHAEAVQIVFDPRVITYQGLLEVFFSSHDPTTPNRQGADVGTQYRSVVFYHGYKQRDQALQIMAQEQHTFTLPIVTQIVPFVNFYPAEEHHQRYFELNSSQPYCRLVISPKLDRFRRKYRSLVETSPES